MRFFFSQKKKSKISRRSPTKQSRVVLIQRPKSTSLSEFLKRISKTQRSFVTTIAMLLIGSIFFYTVQVSGLNVDLYPAVCEGSWREPILATGAPDVAVGSTVDLFNRNNSAVFSDGVQQIVCRGFDRGDINDLAKISGAQIRFSLAVDVGGGREAMLDSGMVEQSESNSKGSSIRGGQASDESDLELITDPQAVERAQDEARALGGVVPESASAASEARESVDESSAANAESAEKPDSPDRSQGAENAGGQNKAQPEESSSPKSSSEPSDPGSDNGGESSSEPQAYWAFVKTIYAQEDAPEPEVSEPAPESEPEPEVNENESEQTEEDGENELTGESAGEVQEGPVDNAESEEESVADDVPQEAPSIEVAQISYSFDGEIWYPLGAITNTNWDNLVFDLPFSSEKESINANPIEPDELSSAGSKDDQYVHGPAIVNWQDIRALQFKVEGSLFTLDIFPAVFLDGMELHIQYEEGEEEILTQEEIDALPRVEVPASHVFGSGPDDFRADEQPGFAVELSTDPLPEVLAPTALPEAEQDNAVSEETALEEPASASVDNPEAESPVESPESEPILEEPVVPIEPAPDSSPPAASEATEGASEPSAWYQLVPLFSGIQTASAQVPPARPVRLKILKTEVFDPSGDLVDVKPLVDDINGELTINIPKPPSSFKPGRYQMRVEILTDDKVLVTNHSFTWGILAVNTNQIMFVAGEKVYLQMAALSEAGHTRCDALLQLEITSPNGKKEIFSVEQSTITVNKTCGPDTITSEPDYAAYYTATDIGTHEMKLKDTSTDYEITSSFTVVKKSPLEIKRIGPTRINPTAPYVMTIVATAHEDIEGVLYERAPTDFLISDTFGEVRVDEQGNNIGFGIRLAKGEVRTLTYTFDAPDVSPYLYLLGPLRFEFSTQAELREQLSRATDVGAPEDIPSDPGSPKPVFIAPEDAQTSKFSRTLEEARAWQLSSDAVARFSQEEYQWYRNRDDVQPDIALAEENIPLTIMPTEAILRLRMNIGLTHTTLPPEGAQFKLQVTDDSDPSRATWVDVSADESGITFGDNGTPETGTIIKDNALLGSHRKGTYSEGNPTGFNQDSVNDGELIEWDFALNVGGAKAGTYYFRMLREGGGIFHEYARYPSIIIQNETLERDNPRLRGWNFRQGENPDGTIQATFHGKWVNYLDESGDWQQIDTDFVRTAGGFEMIKAPFTVRLPLFANQAAIFENNNRYNTETDEVIIDEPLTQDIVSDGVLPVPGTIVRGDITTEHGVQKDINYVLYGNAYRSGADLIYYVDYAQAPRLQKLIRFSDAGEYTAHLLEYPTTDFSLTYSTDPDFYRHGQGRGSKWDERGELRSKDMSVRVQTSEARGIGLRNFAIWDSAGHVSPLEVSIVKDGASHYTLSKILPADFSQGVTFPVFTDTTTTFYPDPNTETTSVDGTVSYSSTVYATVQAAVTGSTANDTSASAIFLRHSFQTPQYPIMRAFFLFDTSAITASATISSAVFSLSGNGVAVGDVDGDTIEVVSSTPAADTAIALADFDQLGTTSFASMAISTWATTSGNYNDFTLSSPDDGKVSKTGITKLGTRAGRDLSATAPTGQNHVSTFFADQTGTGTDPKLTVTYATTTAISGTVYTDVGSTTATSSVSVSINGGTKTTTSTDSGGAYIFPAVTPPTSGDVITVWMDNAGAGNGLGAAVTRYGSGDLTGFNIYKNYLITRHDNSGPLTNTDIDACTKTIGTGCADSDLHFDVATSTSALTVDNDWGLYLWNGKTFAPSSTVTLSNGAASSSVGGDIVFASSTSVLSMANNEIFVGGDWRNDQGGTFSASSTQTTTFTATTTGFKIVQSGELQNVTFNGVGGAWTLSTTSMSVAGTLAMANGTLDSQSPGLTVRKNFVGTSGVLDFDCSGCAVFLSPNASSAVNFGATNADWSFYDLFFRNEIPSGASTTITTEGSGTGNFTIYNQLTIEGGALGANADTILNARNRTWTVSSTVATPFILATGGMGSLANLDSSSSTFVFKGVNGSGNVTIPSETYWDLTINENSETFVLGGNATTTNNLAISSGTLDITTRLLDVNGNMTISSGASFNASTTFSVAKNFTSNGTFSVGSSTIVFDSTATSTITGPTSTPLTFWNFTASTANKPLVFATSTPHFRTNGLLTLRGTSGNRLLIDSTQSGTQWFINHQGTEDVEFISIKDGGCISTSTDITVTNTPSSTDRGNNDLCWLTAPIIAVTGTVFSNRGVTTATSVVKLAVGSTSSYTASTDSSGIYIFPTVREPATSTVVTVWMNNNGGGNGTGAAVARYLGTGNITSFDIYKDNLIIRHDDAGPVANTDLDECDKTTGSACTDSDLHFEVVTSTSALTLDSDWGLYLSTADTFTPGGAVTLTGGAASSTSGGDLMWGGAASVLDIAGNALSIGGDWFNAAGGTFTRASTHTLTFAATQTGMQIAPSTTQTFANLIFNGSGGSWSATSAPMIISGNITMTAGTVDNSVGDALIYVNAGDATGTSGVFNFTTSSFTVVQNGSGTRSLGASSSSWTFYNLTLTNNSTSSGPARFQFVGPSTVTTTVSRLLTIGTSSALVQPTIWSASNSQVAFTGAVPSPLLRLLVGQVTFESSTVAYTGNNAGGDTTVDTSAIYWNLAFNNASETYVPATLLVDNDFSIVAGTANLTSGVPNVGRDLTISTSGIATLNNTVTIGRNLSNNGTFNAASSTVAFNALATSTITNSSTLTFWNFTSQAASKPLIFGANQTFRVDGALTLAGTAGNPMSIDSTASGTQWLINHQGTEDVSYVTVKDSGCVSTSTYISVSYINSVDRGNNGFCWAFPSLSLTISPLAISLALEDTNTFTASATNTLTVSTNGELGYSLKAYQESLLTRSNATHTIANWTGTNAVPTTWTTTCIGSATCGFGYSTNDADLTQFSSTKFAAFTTSTPGDEVALSTGRVTGDATIMTYRTSVDQVQRVGDYQTTIRYIVAPKF